MTLPKVSVVAVNYNGHQHLEPCFSSLLKQDYPADQTELILIDNASKDGSLELMAARFPGVRVIGNSTNIGFAPAVNQGVAAATGQYVALINNDAYADPSWLSVLVKTMQAHRERNVACVGAKMLDWYGQRIDFVTGGVNAYGMGNQFFHRVATNAVKVGEHDLLFACGGAMLADRDVFLRIGGFDEDYFAYFEDVDFGWRMWIYGYRVVLAPDAVVFHRQHATSSTMYNYQINTLFERNALLTIIKNYDDTNLNRVLGVALLLMVQRSLSEAGSAVDRKEFDVGYRNPQQPRAPEITVPKMAISHLVALKDILENFPHVWDKRRKIQAERARVDHDILPLFRYPMGASYHHAPYLILQQRLMEAFDIGSLFSGAPLHRVLILSTDPLYDKLAGPGIRAVEMARYLAGSCHVILAAPERADVEIPNVTCVALHREKHEDLERLLTEVEVVVIQGYALRRYPFLRTMNRILVVDLYDPFHLENLQIHSRNTRADAQYGADFDRGVINELLGGGDFFICASERQRDFWLGALGSIGRLAPSAYADDPTYRGLIDVVPFGIEPAPPQHQQQVLKGVIPGIEPDDKVILWGGGIWDWLDPRTVIRALNHVSKQRSDIKLFFMGHQHPNPAEVPVMPMHDQAVALAKELGLYNHTVFFNDRWVPYAERANYFLEADIGVSAHLDHVETRFAFRTRLLDYIWTGLPMVLTTGDTLADAVAEQGMGYAVAIGDDESFAEALLQMASVPDLRQTYAKRFITAQRQFAWPQVLHPLIKFCQQPRYAADKGRGLGGTSAAWETSGPSPALQQRVHELEALVAQKNEHINHLENLIKRISSGRLMRLMRIAGRARR